MGKKKKKERKKRKEREVSRSNEILINEIQQKLMGEANGKFL
jgi:hypothetical protein